MIFCKVIILSIASKLFIKIDISLIQTLFIRFHNSTLQLITLNNCFCILTFASNKIYKAYNY